MTVNELTRIHRQVELALKRNEAGSKPDQWEIAAGPGGPTRLSETSDTLPVNERTCERCFVLSRADEDRSTVEDQPVGELPPPDPIEDEVPVP